MIDTELMSSKQRFRLALLSFPRLAPYWNTHGDSFRYEELKADIGGFAHGERVMAGFFISIWRGENEGFDLIDAAGVLGNKERIVILDWISDPYWP